ncbi:MAG: class I SAM-dependent methyltransferase [Opitutales bacterium]
MTAEAMRGDQDHFSSIARDYAQARLRYPDALYAFLSAQCPRRDLAWDCATGSGQAEQDLAGKFQRVIATDLSPELLALAKAHPRIEYRARLAEDSGLASASVDLITVAQAIHWFDLERFWPEAARVLKPRGVLAFWGYCWPQVCPDVDRVLDALRAELAPYWPARSARLLAGYAEIRPPLPAIAVPAYQVEVAWSRHDYVAHLRSWSAARYHREHHGIDLLDSFALRLAAAWPATREVRVTWPLVAKAFRQP